MDLRWQLPGRYGFIQLSFVWLCSWLEALFVACRKCRAGELMSMSDVCKSKNAVCTVSCLSSVSFIHTGPPTTRPTRDGGRPTGRRSNPHSRSRSRASGSAFTVHAHSLTKTNHGPRTGRTPTPTRPRTSVMRPSPRDSRDSLIRTADQLRCGRARRLLLRHRAQSHGETPQHSTSEKHPHTGRLLRLLRLLLLGCGRRCDRRA